MQTKRKSRSSQHGSVKPPTRRRVCEVLLCLEREVVRGRGWAALLPFPFLLLCEDGFADPSLVQSFAAASQPSFACHVEVEQKASDLRVAEGAAAAQSSFFGAAGGRSRGRDERDGTSERAKAPTRRKQQQRQLWRSVALVACAGGERERRDGMAATAAGGAATPSFPPSISRSSRQS